MTPDVHREQRTVVVAGFVNAVAAVLGCCDLNLMVRFYPRCTARAYMLFARLDKHC